MGVKVELGWGLGVGEGSVWWGVLAWGGEGVSAGVEPRVGWGLERVRGGLGWGRARVRVGVGARAGWGLRLK